MSCYTHIVLYTQVGKLVPRGWQTIGNATEALAEPLSLWTDPGTGISVRGLILKNKYHFDRL